MSQNNFRNGSSPSSKLEELQPLWEAMLRHSLRDFDPASDSTWSTRPTAEQRAELYRSTLTDETIAYQNQFNIAHAKHSARLLNNKYQCANRGNALFYPYYNSVGRIVYVKAKFQYPGSSPKAPKYVGPWGLTNADTCYFPRGTHERLRNKPPFIFVTEGEKKALALHQLGFSAISINGVWGGQEPKSSPDSRTRRLNRQIRGLLDELPEHCRTIISIFDSDAVDNAHIRLAEETFGKLCSLNGYKFGHIRLDSGPNGEKVGVDDFLFAGGTKEDLLGKASDVLAGPMKLPKYTCKDFIDHAEGFIDSLEHPLTYGYGSRYWEYSPEKMLWVELSREKLEIRLMSYLTSRYSGVSGKTVTTVMGLLPHMLLADESHLDAEPPFWLGEPKFDLPGKIFTQNEIVAPLTGETHPVGPDIFYTSSIDTTYDANAPKPKRWLQFLEESFPGDEASKCVLQEMFGYLLTLGNSLQKVFLILGPAGCGKGTIVRVLEALLRKESVAATSMKALGESHGLEDLVGKSLATINEIRVNSRTDVNEALNQLLSISGGDAVRINPKGIKGYACRLTVRFLLTTNEIPSLTDAAGALDRRLVALRMCHKPAKVETDLDEQFRLELPGILNWAIEGRRRLIDVNKGKFTEIPRRDDEMSLAEMIVENGALIQTFVGDRCILGEELTVSWVDMQLSYEDWCQAVGEKPRSQRKMVAEITAAFPQVRATRPLGSDGRSPRMLKGITLKNQGEMRPPHVQTY
jgi:P4 family phage/plasmid primase-like protien